MTNTVSEATPTPFGEGGSQSPSPVTALAMSTQIQMITGNDLARALGFEGVTASFRSFCQAAGIKPLPGRRNCYDPSAVRYRLNCIQGIGVSRPAGISALEQSKERRHA